MHLGQNLILFRQNFLYRIVSQTLVDTEGCGAGNVCLLTVNLAKFAQTTLIHIIDSLYGDDLSYKVSTLITFSLSFRHLLGKKVCQRNADC